jgi:hypothetical protein
MASKTNTQKIVVRWSDRSWQPRIRRTGCRGTPAKGRPFRGAQASEPFDEQQPRFGKVPPVDGVVRCRRTVGWLVKRVYYSIKARRRK